MTEIQPAHYTQGACHTAQGDRLVLASLVCQEGVTNLATDLLVSPGGGMSVNVAAGSAFVQGDSVSEQGMYHVANDATKNLVIAASDPTDDRIDLVVAQVRDSQYAGANDDWILTVIQGIPAPAPVPPALPASAYLLATVLVANGVGSITAGAITDERENFVLCGTDGSGHTYRKLLGTLRNTGAGWDFIDDASHRPAGMGVVTQTATGLTVDYDFTGTKVGAVVVAPDETFSAQGIRVGASVGLSSMTIQMFDEAPDRITDRVFYNGSSWQSEHGVYSGFGFVGGVLTLSHENMQATTDSGVGVALGGRGSAIEKVGNLTASTTQVVFYTGSGGSLTAVVSPTVQLCNVHVTRFGHREPGNISPLDPADVIAPFGNLWIIGEIEV